MCRSALYPYSGIARLRVRFPCCLLSCYLPAVAFCFSDQAAALSRSFSRPRGGLSSGNCALFFVLFTIVMTPRSDQKGIVPARGFCQWQQLYLSLLVAFPPPSLNILVVATLLPLVPSFSVSRIDGSEGGAFECLPVFPWATCRPCSCCS